MIRDRSPADGAALEAIALETHLLDRYPVYLPDDVRSFIVSSDALAAWVAIDDGVVVGHVALHHDTLPEVMDVVTAATGLDVERLAVVARLLVAPAARRRGLGRALVDRAVAEAGRLGRRAVLDVVDLHRAAISLYEEAGWTAVGTVEWSLPGDRPLREFVYLAPDTGPRR